MLSTLAGAWKIKELRSKIIFTFMMIFVLRIGAQVPLPFFDKEILNQLFAAGEGSILSFLNMMSGQLLSQSTVLALGVYPYINASIIMQLLTIAIPKLEELSKEGEEGRKQIGKYTRYMAVVLATVQSYGYVFGIGRTAITTDTFIGKVTILVTAVAGASFVIWIGDQITEKGIGNGVSVIIFLGIISRLPHTAIGIFQAIRLGMMDTKTMIYYIITGIVLLLIVAFVVIIQEGERRIGVQYAKRVVGRKMYGGQSTHIPIKVNMASVMPVIFASSIMAVPSTLAMFNPEGGFSRWLATYLTPTGSIFGFWYYLIISTVLIIFFAFFYNTIQFNTVEYSKNLQQNGGFIPGIRPGKPTSEYLGKVVSRITLVGGIALAILAALPLILSRIMGTAQPFGGTSIIIVVGVCLETVKQLEAQMMMRHYKGFLN